MGSMKSRYLPARRALLFWTVFIGLGAVAGAANMLLDPTGASLGMETLLPYFQKLPLAEVLYQDYRFPGIALLVVNGLTNLTAAGLLLAKRPGGILLGGLFGVTLMLWISIPFYLFPRNVLSVSYFLFGFLQAITGYMAWVFYQQERFSVSEGDYPKIGTDPSHLVVFFSRMGYTRKLALERANSTGACLYEIKARERTEGTLGFWWCGRYGMHRWPMPIEEIPGDLASFDHVTVCSPIWVFCFSAPVRAFCLQAAGSIREADYILVHHQKTPYWNAAVEMDRLLGLKNSPAESVCCREGRFLTCSRRNAPETTCMGGNEQCGC